MTKVNGFSPEQAKNAFLLSIKAGADVGAACDQARRSRKWYENMRASDKDFAAEVDAARARRDKAKAQGQDPELYNLDFAEWRRRFLNQETYPHQQMWIDVLEGREPKIFHDSIIYEPRDPDRIIINTPPGHAKSTTITAQYSAYKLCMNPAYRIVIISETGEFASQFLYQVRQYLTDPNYVELQQAYGPEDGFKPARGEGRWTNNLLYISGRSLDAADKASKDPSITALGINGQVYGKRADLIILDDAVTGKNANLYEKQFKWLNREVLSRGLGMKVLVVGTRIDSVDLYAYLLDGANYIDGETPWTYMAQPAVLDWAEKPEDWRTLWPKSSQPYDNSREWVADENGLYRAMDGEAINRQRKSMSPGQFALVYQQQHIGEDMTFRPKCVWGSVDKRRKPGPLKAGAWGSPEYGMEGMYTFLSIDPAASGEAFILALAVDRVKREFWVLNAWMGDHTKVSWYANMIEQISPEYCVNEVVFEAQNYSAWAYEDERIVKYCQQMGIRISTSYTGNGNKRDPDFGISSMETLFGTVKRRDSGAGQETGQIDHAGDNIIFLPDPDMSPGIKALIDQLLTWVPSKSGAKLRQDGPMALWFAVTRARNLMFQAGRGPQTHAQTKFSTPRQRKQQFVLPAGRYFPQGA